MYETTLKRPMSIRFHFIQLNSTSPSLAQIKLQFFLTPGHKIKFCGFCCELMDMAFATYAQGKWLQQLFSCTYPWCKLDIGTKISQTITKNQYSLVLLHATNALYIKHKQFAIGFNLVTTAIQVNNRP